MNLLIVESPTKERTISKFVDKNFIVKSSYGHVRDLPKKELGIDIKNNFVPKYIAIPRAKKIIKQLNSLQKKMDKVYLATDFDREGEAIAWHLVKLLKLDHKKINRITFHEITPEAIRDALKTARGIDMNLVDAQQARRILDRLVGYKLSPLLWRKVASGLSAGRVQSVAVRLICDREEEIKVFVTQEYWVIKAELQKTNVPNTNFYAELVEKDGEKVDKFFLKTKSDADEIVKYVEDKQFKVAKITKKEKRRHPYGPYTTATLQQDASRMLRFSPSKTMFIAQQLYEGIGIGEQGEIGLITYMRTDSMNIAETAIGESRRFIERKHGRNFIPAKPKRYRTKLKTAQEAHECIRPTSVYREPEKIRNFLNDNQYKLYSLIWSRFVASQMAPAVYDTVAVDISADRLIFRANGHTIKFHGFLILERDNKTPSEHEDKKDITLPPMKENDILELIKPIPEQHFTEPPPRFNESSLIKELEKHAIGRPSTYAPIVETIIKRRYVNLIEHRFYPTHLGHIVNDLLKEHFTEIVDIDFTAQMEEKLDRIAQGKIGWKKIIDKFYKPFEQKLQTAQQKIVKKKVFQVTNEKCPKCGAVMHLREGRYGQFLSCSKWPECKSKIPLDRFGKKKIVEKLDELCPQCGKNLLKRKGRRGPFIACSGYPKCRYTRKIDTPRKSSDNIQQ